MTTYTYEFFYVKDDLLKEKKTHILSLFNNIFQQLERSIFYIVTIKRGPKNVIQFGSYQNGSS